MRSSVYTRNLGIPVSSDWLTFASTLEFLFLFIFILGFKDLPSGSRGEARAKTSVFIPWNSFSFSPHR